MVETFLTMFATIHKIFFLFSRAERRQIYWLLMATLVMAFMEVIGIASVMPFIAVVANPEIIHTNKYLNYLFLFFGFQDPKRFLFFVGIGATTTLLISIAFSAFTTWNLLRFTYMCGHTLSERLLTKYLSQPFVFFLNRNSAELIKNILTEVNRFVIGILIPFMYFVVKLVVILFILILLIAIDPLLSLIVMLTLGGSYMVIFVLTRKRLAVTGKESGAANTQRYKIASEALGGIKDIKVLGRESELVKNYSKWSRLYAEHETGSQTIPHIPRYALEAIAFGGILVIVIYLINVKSDISQALPLISLYAFAGYRLMPALQQVFASISTIRYFLPTLDILYTDLSTTAHAAIGDGSDIEPAALEFVRDISFEDVTFAYPGSRDSAISRLSLCIKADTTVGLVGLTGSGKTTIADLVLGLFSPDQGRVLIDGVVLNPHNIRNWQKNLGYVPQNIYLLDDTIIKNIAFAVPDEEIDFEKAKHAAHIANLSVFIERELKDGYQTVIGERGVRLSGGQRQRIGIARALYSNPKVLVLDEATSSLDGITESAIMDAIHNFSHKKTMIVIAHRLGTIKECDVIYLLDKGKVVGSGTYLELLKSNPQFRKMADVA